MCAFWYVYMQREREEEITEEQRDRKRIGCGETDERDFMNIRMKYPKSVMNS